MYNKKIIDEQISSFDREKENHYLSNRSSFDALATIRFYFNNEQKTDSVFRSRSSQQLIDQCRNGLIFII
jgi:hypothetical protein